MSIHKEKNKKGLKTFGIIVLVLLIILAIIVGGTFAFVHSKLSKMQQVDLNEDDFSLWDSFVKSRNLNYIKAKEKILEQTKEMALQFKEGYYDNKVIVSEAAASRPDFCNKYYRR